MQIQNILRLLKTTDNANNFVSLIDTLISSLYTQTGLKTEDLMQKTFPARVTDALCKDLSFKNIPLNDREGVKKYLTELKEAIEKTTSLSLTLAFDPSSAFIDMIYRWIIENLSQNSLLLLRTDPKILGGVILEFSGLYRDYTLKKQIDEIFNQKTEVSFARGGLAKL